MSCCCCAPPTKRAPKPNDRHYVSGKCSTRSLYYRSNNIALFGNYHILHSPCMCDCMRVFFFSYYYTDRPVRGLVQQQHHHQQNLTVCGRSTLLTYIRILVPQSTCHVSYSRSSYGCVSHRVVSVREKGGSFQTILISLIFPII